MSDDPSRGYDAVADEFIQLRSDAGIDVIRSWASELPMGGCVLDLAAGSGWPVTATLAEAGLRVFALDASPRMVTEFRSRYSDIEVACQAVETGDWFN